MDYFDWLSRRLTILRQHKGVSARDMSLSLGQSASYINKIENKRTMPSMAGFFYICEYLGVTPQDFFSMDVKAPAVTKELAKEFGKLTPCQAEHLICIIKDLNR